MKKITLLFTFLLLWVSATFSANLYLVANNGSTWTSTPSGFDNVYKVDLSNSGSNGTTAVSLTQWLNDRNAATPTYLINGVAGVTFATTDQVWIAGGTYNVAIAWSILSGSGSATPANIYGGFSGNEITVAERTKGANNWDFTNETTINGSGSTTGIFNAGADRTIVIDGLTFSSCASNAGQAVYQRPNMTIQNCKFTSNACVALRYYISSASKTASTTNCYFSGNTNTVSGGAEGGCIMANNGSAGGTYTVSGCMFDSNSCTASGSGASAGIKAQGAGNVVISNCIFKNNNATAGNSSAVSLTSATCTLKNSLVYGTSVATNKTALYVTAGSVINCTVVNNIGGGIYLSNTTASTINLINTVFWGEDAKSGQIAAVASCLGTISNCAYTSISTNFTGTNSSAVDLTTTSTGVFTDPANNIWTLATASPLVDMGTATNAPTTDILGTVRPQGSGIDIGAYERTPTTGIAYVKQLSWRVIDGSLMIDQLEKNTRVNIYSVTGKNIYSTISTDNTVSIALSKGIYIVNVNNINTKVVVNK